MAQTPLFRISSDGFPVTAQVVSVVGHEAISEPYLFQIGLEINDDSFNPDAALRARATLHISQGPSAAPYFVHGVIASVELLHQHAGKALYRATLVPKLWHLNHDVHSRIYTDATIIEIIEAVLRAGGLVDGDFRFQVLHDYPKIEHVCQYKESGLDFISRWMEREGLYYFFEQEDSAEKLVITDSISFHGGLSSGHVRYVPLSGSDSMALEALDTFMAKHSALPSSVKLTDYDYLRPTLDLQGSHGVDERGLGKVQLFGENLSNSAEGARYAKVRAEELLSGQKLYFGHGRVFHLRPNYRFVLEEHPNPAYGGKSYLVTELEHVGNQAATDERTKSLLGISGVATDEYSVRLTAIGADVQYRAARRHGWPRIDGYELARVDGESESEYAQLDEHGRYKCRILFDESDLTDGSATTWVRMMQPHGGSIEGFHFPLRKGTEVVVFFLAGDPDRPVVAGVTPNPLKQSPVTSANHTKNVIQTGGRNRLELEDQAGAQRITMSTPYSNTHIRMGCPNDAHELKVYTDDNTLLEAGQSLEITSGSWRKDLVKKGFFNTTVEDGPVTDVFNGTHTTTIKDLVTETYNNGQRTTVNAALHYAQYNVGSYTEVNGGIDTNWFNGGHEVHYSGCETRFGDGPQLIEIKGSRTVKVTGPVTNTYESTYTVNATGAIAIESQASASLTVKGENKDFVFGNSLSYGFSASEDFKLAASLAITAGIDVAIKASAAFNFSIGASIDITAGVSLSVDESLTYEAQCIKLGTATLKMDNVLGPRLKATAAALHFSSFHLKA